MVQDINCHYRSQRQAGQAKIRQEPRGYRQSLSQTAQPGLPGP
jgi:hypothetical protein